MRVLAVALLLVASACGNGDSESRPQPQPPSAVGAPTRDGGLSVAEAKASELTGPLLVRGYVIETDGGHRLCDAILESDPPQCGEPSLRVEGVAAADLRALFDRREQVSLLGDLRGDTIVVADTAQG